MKSENTSPDELVIAIPKGRVLKQLGPRLEAAGLDAGPLFAEGRELIRHDPKLGIRYLLLKPDDVPTWLEYGAADLGILGRDVLLERDYDLYAPLDLGIGRCRMMVCGHPGAEIRTSGGRALRVATKFPGIAARYFKERGIATELIYVGGSVELAPLTGLADLIVDIVETGATLRANGLVPLETITEISSLVVANRASFALKRTLIAPLLEQLASAESR